MPEALHAHTTTLRPTLGPVPAVPPTVDSSVSTSWWPPRLTLGFDDRTPVPTLLLSAFVGSLLLTVGLMATGLVGDDLTSLLTREGVHNFGLSQCIAFSLWVFGAFLNTRWLPRYINWTQAPQRAVIIALLSNIVGVFVIVPCIFFIFFVVLSDWSLSQWWRLVTVRQLLPSVFLTLLITTIYQSIHFLQEWRDAALRAEQLNSATLMARFETLNAQVNPHFLFNSLNVLSALVRRDPVAAEAFIQGLSEVYRYVLEVREQATVPLSRELRALDAYAKLVTMRFGEERLQIQVRVDPADERPVVPLALQMLIENAVKHNGATRKTPLVIEVLAEADHLTVRNNRVAQFESPESAGMGLTNIIERYRLATGGEVMVEEAPTTFTVKLPL